MDSGLPFVDEHQVFVEASADAVWRALVEHVGGGGLGASAGLANLLGTEPRRASGRLSDEGATLAGFEVARAVPGELLRLTGRHRFSRYALTFTLDARPDGTVLGALTHAEFPGLHGRLYRLLVIGSGGHRIVVLRLLRAVRREAQGQIGTGTRGNGS